MNGLNAECTLVPPLLPQMSTTHNYNDTELTWDSDSSRRKAWGEPSDCKCLLRVACSATATQRPHRQRQPLPDSKGNPRSSWRNWCTCWRTLPWASAELGCTPRAVRLCGRARQPHKRPHTPKHAERREANDFPSEIQTYSWPRQWGSTNSAGA